MTDDVMPIAIVGLSCRLPGGVSNLEDLWQVLAEQRDVWQPMPNKRMNNEAFYHPDPGRNGTSNALGAYFLKEDPGLFDAKFFNLTETEARAMDPQQRLLLELSYEALENAGMPLSSIKKSKTAVFIGSSCRDYADLLRRDSEKTELYQPTGLAQTMLSNRISYFFDLNGPSVTVDTACSSSLVALHLACNALRVGDAQAAIVGASNLILSHEPMIDMSMLRFLSPDGRCYTFDDRANGFGRGEGATCLVLKPLEDALRDGDNVRAVIRNSGTNQDGRTAGISMPSGDAQIELMKATYEAAGLDPAQTTYVEAHGTGTPTGDPIEAASLSKFFAQCRPADQSLMIGSLKSNLGHLEGASGVAAVVKVVLMLENDLILPNHSFQKPNARIPMDKWNIQVPKSVQPWPSDGVRRASVNNFGFGGSNAHIIMDDASSYVSSRSLSGKYQRLNVRSDGTHSLTNGYADAEGKDESYVFVLSSFDEHSGKQQAKNLAQYLRNLRDSYSDELIRDLAYTLSERRSNLPWKAAFTAHSLPQLEKALSSEDIKFSRSHQPKNLGFVFTGQGAQWHAMGRELITQYPVFRKSLDLADQYLAAMGAPWSLYDELSKDAATSRVKHVTLSQPLTTALQIALVDLLTSWNIIPTRVTGHSSGEIAAAYCVGRLTQKSAIAIAFHRGIVAEKLKETKNGAMLAVGLSEEETEPLFQSLRQGCVKVACINSPSNVTISGDREAILELSTILKARDIFCRELAVEVAYHSQHMEEVAEEYLATLRDVSAADGSQIEFYSSVTGKRVPLSDLGIDYWVSNMVEPVQFSSSVHSLLLHGCSNTAVEILLEIGPHSALQGPITQILQQYSETNAARVQYKPSLVRNANAIDTCHELVALLVQNRCPVNLNAVNFASGLSGGKLLSNLPPYAWNHSKSYWTQNIKTYDAGQPIYSRSDLLGVRIKGSISTEPRWRNIIRPTEIPWVNDHVVQSSTLYPAAGFLAMAIEAGYQHAHSRRENIRGYQLREISISHALIISRDAENVETMVSLRPYNESLRMPSGVWDEFSIHSSTDGSSWTEHCRGLISVQQDVRVTEVDGGRQNLEESDQFRHMISKFEEECITAIDYKEFYKSLDRLGLKFGPTFTNLRNVRVAADKCCAEVSIPDTAAVMPAQFEYPFIIHPATLDSCIHALFPIGARYSKSDQGTPVPTFIEELFVSHRVESAPGHVFSVYAESRTAVPEIKASTLSNQGTGSLAVFDKGGMDSRPKVSLTGLVFKSLPNITQDGSKGEERKVCYQLDWQPDPSLLSPAQAVEISAPFRKSFPQRDHARLSQQAAFYYAERALGSISAEEVPAMQPHHQKLYTALTSYCDAVHNGQLGVFSTRDWLHLDAEQRTAVCAGVAQTPYGILLRPIGESLPQILRQQIDPLSVMVEDDRLESYYRTWEPIKQSYQQAAVFIKLLGHKNPHLNILEIGAGTGGATLPILEALSGNDKSSPNFASYDFTDLSPAFFEKAAKKLERWSGLMTFRRLDADVDPVEQGYKSCSYDLIVAANVVHATSRIQSTMKFIRKLLKPGGTVVLIEITANTIGASLIFGTLPGWWSAKEESRSGGPLLTEDQWNDMLVVTGFTGPTTTLWDMPDAASHQSSTIISTIPVESRKHLPAVNIVIDDQALTSWSTELQSLLTDAGVDCRISSLSECDPTNRICIVLCELTRSVLRNPEPSVYEAVRSVFLESSGVLWVTEGALVESSNPDLSLVTGLARTIRVEKGDTSIITLDLDAQNPLSAHDRVTKIFSVFMTSFGKENGVTSNLELEYVERCGTIMIPRILENHHLSASEPLITESVALNSEPYYQEGRPLRAIVGAPGFLDSVHFVVDDRNTGELADDHVEIQVKASGFNFRDVMTALGQISAYPLGCECSGVVTAVGRSVRSLQLGNRVIATVKDGCFCNTIRTLAEEVELVPDDIPYDVAAALPIVYFTAYLAVFKTARLSKGETVLIHAGSGGLGQAIITLCQLVGATIFATVGTVEKRRLLVEKYNIPEENIFSSRDTTFAKGVMTMTQGKGVDVIMNSLSGEALHLSWNCIAPFGRFVELGKRDFTINTRLEMRNFEKNVSFTGIDLPFDSMRGERKKIWGEIMALYGRGLIRAPSPITVFGVSEMHKALRIMQSGKHMGKLVLMPRHDEKVQVAPSSGVKLLRDDASYLLVGGLGGIGRATALWMLNHGAKNFVFASRSGSDKQNAKDLIAMLKAQGARVCVSRCDISNSNDLDRLLKDCEKEMPTIRGVIHGALVSKADLFARMKLEDYNDVMRPKVDGIWNLHNALSQVDLDFFIMLSSVVGIAGDPSQAAYVSASVFEDAFADFRNRQGLPAVTLDLGKVVDIGIVAEKFLARRGVRGLWSRDLREGEVMAMIESAIVSPRRSREPGSVIIGLKAWTETADPVFQAPLFSHFRRAGLKTSRKNDAETPNAIPRIRETLRYAESMEEAAQKVCAELISKTSNLLMVPMEDISPAKSMLNYGMDSLVAVEMRNWLLRELDTALPVLELMANTSLQELSRKIAGASKLVRSGLFERKELR